MAYYLGIDGGGTSTAAWLADGDGRVVGRGEGGPSNPLKVGLFAAQRSILAACQACFRNARVGFPRPLPNRSATLRAVCAGISGIDRKEVYRPLLAWMRRWLPARRIILTTDVAIALAAAVGDAPGIILIAGTGSIGFARDAQGNLVRAGGWGVPFDDRGSGYDLGRKAVRAALEAFDGRGPQTLLMPAICRGLKLASIVDVVAKQLAPPQIAAIFPWVMEAAEAGDRVARRLCDEAAEDLASLAAALLKRLGCTRRAMPVIITGGVFESSARIRSAFGDYLHRHAAKARVVRLKHPAVEGALWLARARDQAGPKVTRRK